jgi:DNA polymerase-1
MPAIPELPAIRRLYRPDPGYLLVDVDYERADAQFVGWESDEPDLKRIFQSGLDIYTDEAKWLYQTDTIKPDQRQRLKSVVHAADYAAKARTLASTAGCTVARMERWLDERWIGRHPGLGRWHNRIKHQLQLSRQVHNAWGFRRFYFDRLDNVLPQALAWIAQSGVAITINKAMLRIDRELPEAQLLLQIHDSLLLQVRKELAPDIFPIILEKMRIVVPYKDPLIIPASLKWSDTSWGEMVKWEDKNHAKAA